VQRIRGRDGSTVKLFVQRDAREWTAEVVRGQVTVDAVSGVMLPGAVGYLRITSFKETTLAQLDGVLRRLKPRAVVLDLRGPARMPGRAAGGLGCRRRSLPRPGPAHRLASPAGGEGGAASGPWR